MLCWPGTLASDPVRTRLRAAMAETGARQAALRFAHQRHHLSALDGLTPERVRRSGELRGSRTRSHRAAAAKDEDRSAKLHEAHVPRHEGDPGNLRRNRDVRLPALVGHLHLW